MADCAKLLCPVRKGTCVATKLAMAKRKIGFILSCYRPAGDSHCTFRRRERKAGRDVPLSYCHSVQFLVLLTRNQTKPLWALGIWHETLGIGKWGSGIAVFTLGILPLSDPFGKGGVAPHFPAGTFWAAAPMQFRSLRSPQPHLGGKPVSHLTGSFQTASAGCSRGRGPTEQHRTGVATTGLITGTHICVVV